MQKGYRYVLSAPIARGFDPDFKPQLTPAQMLKLGVFGGKYMTDCRREFPKSWFAGAKLSPRGRDRARNFFSVEASQPLSEWKRKGWIHPDDPRGWFQWYCRYYMGRRIPDEDRRRSIAGKRSAAMCGRCRNIASRATSSADAANGRHCCIGPTTAAKFEKVLFGRDGTRAHGPISPSRHDRVDCSHH
jgi:hypothetical protein